MTVDGNMADWAVIHADLDNNVCDGPPIADRDAPVQSTGRDLTHFAFTWDATSIYLFTSRAGSANNVQRFVYYADIDNDGLMETGEPVIGANWSGSTRLVEVYLFQYVAVAAGGDPMVDGGGFADGYTLPGGFQNVPSQNIPRRERQLLLQLRELPLSGRRQPRRLRWRSREHAVCGPDLRARRGPDGPPQRGRLRGPCARERGQRDRHVRPRVRDQR
jgi:hypothetical protein